jgi:hypothetical protein
MCRGLQLTSIVFMDIPRDDMLICEILKGNL